MPKKVKGISLEILQSLNACPQAQRAFKKYFKPDPNQLIPFEQVHAALILRKELNWLVWLAGSYLPFSKYVILSGALNPHFCDSESRNPLLIACIDGHSEIAKWLLSLEDDVNAKVHDYFNPLMAAAYMGQIKITKILLRSGACLNVYADDGFTPLMYAAQQGRESIVRMFLSLGACWEHENDFGQTACDLARHNGHDNIVKIIERHARKNDLPATRIA